MSLNGTLETFALPDVLALLATTKKTGELKVEGGRGAARLWLDKGQMVGADVPRAKTFVDAMFEMLRLTSGNFAFDNDGTAPEPAEPMALEPLLLEAQSRLAEWRSIEAVVPSTAHRVSLTPEVSTPKVSVSRDQWKALVAVAAGADVEAVIAALRVGEFDGCRLLKDLVDAGLVSVAEPLPAPVAPPATKPAPAPAPAPEVKPAPAPEPKPAPAPAPAVAVEPEAPFTTSPRRPLSPAKAAPGADRGNQSLAQPGVARQPFVPPQPKSPAPAAPAPALAATPPAPAQPRAPVSQPRGGGDTADLVHQLAALQEAAAEPPAVRHATARSGARVVEPEEPTTEPNTEPDDAAVEDPAPGDEPINRGLLLKFLNSVRS